MPKYPFNDPYISANSLKYISDTLVQKTLIGGSHYSNQCSNYLSKFYDNKRTFLTGSCSQALELSCLISDLVPGDEVILPSYTFSSTANSVVLRGATPVFVDIDDYLCLDIDQVKSATTINTKMIITVHYAGSCNNIQELSNFCRDRNIILLEDAAQAIGSTFAGRKLGNYGDYGAISFHSTKNLGCGEGGCLVVNNEKKISEVECAHEKGTNRTAFIRGEIDKYTWISAGSSFLMSDFTASFLYAQLQDLEFVTSQRLRVWDGYETLLDHTLLSKHNITTPKIYPECNHNAHMYYIILPNSEFRNKIQDYLKNLSIGSVSHYVPLHSAPAGLKYGTTNGKSLPITDKVSKGILRLPLNVDTDFNYISAMINEYLVEL